MIIESNLSYLSDKLKDALDDCDNIELEYKLSKDNNKIPLYNNLVLHSTYTPFKEFEKYTFSKDKNLLCISIGFGAGYHLINHCNQDNDIIVIPIDHKLLKSVLSNIDISKYLNHGRLKIILLDEIQDYFDFSKYTGYYFVIHNVLQNIFPDEITRIIHSIKQSLNDIILEKNTLKKFGFIWHRNILKNIKYFFEGNYDFSPYIIEKPILITGAGPSLEHNISDILSSRNEFHIASTDTAYKILIRHGIIPDAVFTFDAQNYSYLHFTDVNNTRIFSDFTSPVRIQGIKQTMVFSQHPFSSIFFELGFSPVILSSFSRNIGGAVIDFYKKYFPEISMISAGIDYGYYDYSAYSKGSYISDIMIVNSSYFNHSETSDAKFFYRLPFYKSDGCWKTSFLFDDYASNTVKDIASLSGSPFCRFKRTTIVDFLKRNHSGNKKKLFFNNPELTADLFFGKIEIFLKKNRIPLYPYFISKGIKNEEADIGIIIQEIRKYVKQNLK